MFLSGPPPREKRVIICHAWSSKGFAENSLLPCGKELSISYADYHDDMSGIVLEDWFENTLTAKLPKKGKVVVVMYNAKYHCRFI